MANLPDNFSQSAFDGRHLSNAAENRLSMLEHQRDVNDRMLASATECERENEDADWESVIATLTDTKANLKHQIETIAEWDNEQHEAIACERADYQRDLAMMEDA